MKKLAFVALLCAFAFGDNLDLKKVCKDINLVELRREIVMLKNVKYSDATWELSEKEFLFNFGKLFCKDYR